MKKIIFSLLLVSILMLGSVKSEAALPMDGSFAPLVKKTSPAVVNIYTKRVVTERTRSISPFFNDPFFNQFMGGAGVMGRGGVRKRIENSLGSGVIVDGAQGLIATSNHVINEATEISVVMTDGQEYKAEKLLADPRTDLAILKLDDKHDTLPELAIADSDAVEVGDIVLAIGNPFGVGQTVTSGIVSGVARTDVGISDYSFFIQTDAAINPGNSGGALVDMNGALIGINTAIYSKDGGSLGIGFAIPANMVKSVLKAAKAGGKLERPWMGVSSQEVTPDMLEALGLDKVKGALVKKIYDGSPAAKAGIKVGDVIVSINGKEVLDPEAFKFRLATVEIGDNVEMQVIRKGKQLTFNMKAEKAPETTPKDETLIEGESILSGAVVANISPALYEQLGTLEAEEGVIVLEVKGGVAASLGIRKGDIISSINGQEVLSVKELLNMLKSNETHKWKALIQRGKSKITLTVMR